MREKVKIHIEKCRKDAIIPSYANKYDAGMDIYSAEEVVLHPNETKIVPTGLKVAIPPGFEIQIRPRSGISLKTPIRIPNSPGTIDSGYRDEVGVIMTNTSQIGKNIHFIDEKNNSHGVYVIRKGDRIAQMVLLRVPEIIFEEITDVTEVGENRGGGFGSTGI